MTLVHLIKYDAYSTTPIGETTPKEEAKKAKIEDVVLLLVVAVIGFIYISSWWEL